MSRLYKLFLSLYRPASLTTLIATQHLFDKKKWIRKLLS